MITVRVTYHCDTVPEVPMDCGPSIIAMLRLQRLQTIVSLRYYSTPFYWVVLSIEMTISLEYHCDTALLVNTCLRVTIIYHCDNPMGCGPKP